MVVNFNEMDNNDTYAIHTLTSISTSTNASAKSKLNAKYFSDE